LNCAALLVFLQTGEVVLLSGSVSSDWFSGSVGEKEGIFPRAFVKVKMPLPGEVSV